VSLISRLFGTRSDEHAAVRPLWHHLVGIAREKYWYAELGVADTVAGRFDAVTLVLSLAMLRMERSPGLARPCVLLAELFVTDMDGQLRQSGVGDLVVGKHIGRLMSVLGGRLGAYRTALAADGNGELESALSRNLSLRDGADLAALGATVRDLAGRLTVTDDEALLAARIAPGS
jgi:cytochrome b pre-mRNA-processing protein 3